MKKNKKKRERKEKKYFPPILEKHNIKKLSKNWDLEAIGIPTSCSSSCII